MKNETNSKSQVSKTFSLRRVENTHFIETYMNVSSSEKKMCCDFLNLF